MAQNTFHVALYVGDLDAAIARYRKLLGQEPAKVRQGKPGVAQRFVALEPPADLPNRQPPGDDQSD